MPLEKVPFVPYTLEEERKGKPKQDIISVRINEEERKALNTFKAVCDIKSDGKMLKMGYLIGMNVLQTTFPPKFLSYLFKADRIKLSDYEDIDKKIQKSNTYL